MFILFFHLIIFFIVFNQFIKLYYNIHGLFLFKRLGFYLLY